MRYRRSLILEALLHANRLLNGRVRPADEIAQVLRPFYNCTSIEGARSQRHEDLLRSLIFALTADAYRREGSVHEAAILYRHASTISPGGHATIYAHLVCKHRLSDFYADALRTLQEYRRRWLAKPRIVRILLRLFAWRTWADKEGREITRSEDGDYQFLIENAPRTT